MSYPLLTPPVKAATPTGLGGGLAQLTELRAERGTPAVRALDLATAGLDLSDFKQRFFTAGPTNLFRILGDVDARIQGVATQSASAACAGQAPVAYTIRPYGQSIAMYAQCYEALGGSPSDFVQWGSTPDGTFYLWMTVGAGSTAAIATPIPPAPAAMATAVPASARYAVRIWSTVGLDNAPWDAGSYTVMQVVANGATRSFEMTAAGVGIGYCGVQIVSDGATIYGKGSVDMGASCLAPADVCVLAADTTAAGSCSDAQRAFSLPPLGRTAAAGTSTTFAASLYPDAPRIVLDGTRTDDLHFGPTSPTPGVGNVVGP